ncbi:hypothetical protein BKA64DRAFT_648548 [Cadophora sp. MPI-SDFR-AT-0126]|nr:hypothetical protein BKA64DRAFT_648548 [Leotiomycetes sp. MPI-SDFR-AT-0126]
MKLSHFSLLLVALSPVAAGYDTLVFGRDAKTGRVSRDALPIKGMTISKRTKAEIVYARIQREIFYGGFDDALNKRQLCGSGKTCTSACSSCGSDYIWCGTETGGSCDCSDSTGSCTGGGSGSDSDSGGGDICGSGKTCSGACSACGGESIWCGTETDGICDCSDTAGTCSGLGSGSDFSPSSLSVLSVPTSTRLTFDTTSLSPELDAATSIIGVLSDLPTLPASIYSVLATAVPASALTASDYACSLTAAAWYSDLPSNVKSALSSYGEEVSSWASEHSTELGSYTNVPVCTGAGAAAANTNAASTGSATATGSGAGATGSSGAAGPAAPRTIGAIAGSVAGVVGILSLMVVL